MWLPVASFKTFFINVDLIQKYIFNLADLYESANTAYGTKNTLARLT